MPDNNNDKPKFVTPSSLEGGETIGVEGGNDGGGQEPPKFLPPKTGPVKTGAQPSSFTKDLSVAEAKMTAEEQADASPVDFMRNRAREQSTVGQMARAGANLVPNIALGLVENAGYLGELANYGIKELTNQEYKADFSNALTEFARKNRNVFGDNLREDPNEVIDFDDPAWWIQNGEGLLESIGEFLITGAGTGKVISSGVGRIANVINNSMKASRAVNVGAQATSQTLTAGSLGYVEGAMTAADVYNETYDEIYRQTGDVEKAKMEASGAAAKTAKVNTALIGALNVTSMYPLFKSTNLIARAEKFGLTRGAEETSEQFIKRLDDYIAQGGKVPERSLYERFATGIEAGQESLEEVANLYAETTGKQKAGIADTDKKGIELYTDLLFSEEGLLSGTLGALGGAGQTIGMRRIPFYKQAVEGEDGEVKTQHLSAKQMEEMELEDAGVNYAKQLKEDIEEVDKIQKELKQAAEDGNEAKMEDAKRRLFDVTLRRSIYLDGGEAIKRSLEELENVDNNTDLAEQYNEQIAQLEEQARQAQADSDPVTYSQVQEQLAQLKEQRDNVAGETEAMRLGLADSREDTDYKRLAREKRKEVDELVQDFQDTVAQYNYGDEKAFQMGQWVFDLKLRRKRASDLLKTYKKKAQELRQEIDESNEIVDSERGRQIGEIIDLYSQYEGAKKQLQETKKEKKSINRNLEELKRKYKAQNKAEVEKAIDNKINSLEQSMTEAGVGYARSVAEYRNNEELAGSDPDALTTEELVNEIGLNSIQQKNLENYHQAINDISGTYKELSSRYNRVTSAKGRKEFVQTAYKEYQKEEKKREKAKKEREAAQGKEQAKQEQEQAKTAKEEIKQHKEQQKIWNKISKAQSQEALDKIAEEENLNAEQEEAVNRRKLELRQESRPPTEEEPSPEPEGEVESEIEQPQPPVPPEDQGKVEDLTNLVEDDKTEDIAQDGETVNTVDEQHELLNDYDESTKEARKKEVEKSQIKAVGSNKVQYGPVKDYIEERIGGMVYKRDASNNKREDYFKLLESDRIDWGEIPLRLIPDTDYDGPVYDENDNPIERTYDEMRKEGIQNTPVKIIATIDGNDVEIGYLPTMNWLTRQDEEGNYVNAAEVVTDAEGNEINNIDRQVTRLKKIRQTVFDNFEKGGQATETTAEAKTRGRLSKNFETKENGEVKLGSNGLPKPQMDTAEKLLPESSLNIGIIKQGSVQFSKNRAGDDYKNDTTRYANGTVVVEIGDMALPLWIDSLTESQASNIMEAIKAKHLGDESLIEQINDITFNQEYNSYSFKANSGLANFVETIAHSESFSIEDVRDPEVALDRVFFHVSEKSGHVQVAKRADGIILTTDPAKFENEEGYESLLENEETALEYLREIPFSTKLETFSNNQLLNSKDPFTEITIKDGKANSIVHNQYNDYAKQYLKTYIDGRNTINHGTEQEPDLEYVYFEQPVIYFDDSFAEQETTQSEIVEKPAPEDRGNIKDLHETVTEGQTEITEEGQDNPFYVPDAERGTSIEEEEGDTFTDDDVNYFPEMEGENTTQRYVDKELQERLDRYTIADFSGEQQYQITDTILFLASKQMKEGRSPAESFNFAFDKFKVNFSNAIDSGNQSLTNDYLKVLNNWNSFEERARERLDIIGYQIINDDTFEAEDSNYEKTKFDSKARWYQDSKDTASAQLKLFLAFIPDQEYVRDSDGKIKTKENGDKILKNKENWLGLKSYIPFDTVYDELSQLLADTEPSFDNYISILRSAADTNPHFANIAQKLENESEDSTIPSEFVVAMSKQYIGNQLGLWNARYDKSGNLLGYDLKPIASDRNSAIDSIRKGWVEDMKQSNIVTTNEEGELIIDQERVQRLKDRYYELTKDRLPQSPEVQDAFRKLLEEVGINLEDGAFRVLRRNSKRILGQVWTKAVNPYKSRKTGSLNKGNFINLFFDSLLKNPDNPLFSTNSPLINGDMTSRFNSLAATQYTFVPKVYSNSFTNVEGKTIYAYQMNTFLSHRMRRLKDDEYRKELGKLSIAENSLWLKELDADSKALSLEYVDGLKRQGIGQGDVIENLSKADLDLLAATYFFGTVNQTNGRKARYIATTKSDKTTTPLIKAPRVSVGVQIDNRRVTNLSGETTRHLKNVLWGELKRIVQFKQKYKQRFEDSDFNLDGYLEGAENFFMFPYLNYEGMQQAVEDGIITEEELNRIYPGEELVANYDSVDVLMKVVKARTLEEINATYDEWVDAGIIQEDITEADLAEEMYKNDLLSDEEIHFLRQLTTGEQEIQTNLTQEEQQAAEEQLIEYSKINKEGAEPSFIDYSYLKYQTRSFSGDNAKLYAVADFTVNNIVANAEQYRVISGDPALFWKRDVQTTMDNIQKRLAKDIAPKSDNDWRKDELTFNKVTLQDPELSSRMAGLPEAYYDNNMEIADAQEYTTVQEHLRVMRAWGKISPAKYDELVNKIPEDGSYYEFTDAELDIILQPQKPVYVEDKLRPEYDINQVIYTKSSSFPLLPQFTRGTELDKLRSAMERGNIQRAAFKTADKVGAVNQVSVFDGRKIKDDLEFSVDNVQKLDRRGLGLQQEIPVKEKDRIKVVTQMNKLLFSGMRNVEGFEYMGKEMTGRELEQEKTKIRKALFEQNQEELINKLGMEIDEDGSLTVKDKNKIRDLLKQEAKSRGWALNDIEALEVSQDGKEFIIPLSLSGSSKKIESLILSMVSKVVTGQKVKGKSYVQGSSAGLQLEGDTDLSKIVFTENYDTEQGLQFISDDRENNRVKPAQVFVPFDFTDNDGNPLDINDYVNEEGRIDSEKLPPEVLRMIGARIPNQGHSSMLPIEIAGFVPKSMGDLIIVPEEIVTQMGSDFDIDKLYAYHTDYTYDAETNQISKLEVEIPSVETEAVISNDMVKSSYNEAVSELSLEEINEVLETLNKEASTKEDAIKWATDEFNWLFDGEDKFIENFENSLTAEQIERNYQIGLDNNNDDAEAAKKYNELYQKIAKSTIRKAQDSAQQEEADLDYSALSQEELSQLYVDIHWSVLTHREAFGPLTSPLDKPDLENEKRIINKKKGITKSVPDSPLNYRRQRTDRVLQRSGQQLVGVFALMNTFNSVIEDTQKADLKLERYDYQSNERIPFTIDFKTEGGNILRLSTLSGKGTTKYDGEDRTKQENISSLLNIAVDNANVNVAGFINLNLHTAGVAGVMSLLQTPDTSKRSGNALSLDYIARFLSQEAVEVYVEEIEKLQSSLQGQYVSNVQDKALSNTAKRLGMEAAQLTDKEYNTEITDYDKPFSSSELLNLINPDNKTTEYYNKQLAVLNTFRQLLEIAEDVRTVQGGVLNPGTNGTGTSVFDLFQNEENFQEVIGGVDTIANTDKLLVERTSEGGWNYSTEQGFAGKHTLELGKKVVRELFPEIHDANANVFNAVRQLVKVNGVLSTRDMNTLWEGTKGYIYSHSEELGFGNLVEERNRLLYDKKDSPSLAKRIRQAKQSWGADNYFLQRVETRMSEKPGQDPSYVVFQASKGLRMDDAMNSRALASMLVSADQRQQELAKDIIKYAYLTGGRQTATSFVRYIPPQYLEYAGFADTLHEISFTGDSNVLNVSSYNAMKQVLQHNPSMAPNVEEFQMFGKKKEDGTITQFGLLNPEEAGERLENLEFLMNGDPRYPQFLSMRDTENNKWNLYELTHIESGNHYYRQVDTLGKAETVEYNPYQKEVRSQFEDNQSAEIVPDQSNPPRKEPAKQKSEPNKSAGENKLYSYFPETDSDIDSIMASLDNISNGEAYEKIAAIIKKGLQNKKKQDIELGFESLRKGAAYQQGNRLVFDPSYFDDKSQQRTEMVIMHEYMHILTADKIQAYLNDPSSLSKKEREIIKSIEMAFKRARREIIGDQQENFEKYVQDVKDAVKKENRTIPEGLDSTWYYLYNLEEFVSGAMTDPRFQDQLNKIDFNGRETIKTRLMKLIKNLMESIASTFGVDIKEGTALESALTDIVELATMKEPETTQKEPPRDAPDINTLFFPDRGKKIDDSVEKVIQQIDSRISRVKRSIKNTDSQERKQNYINSLEKLQEDKNTLISQASVAGIEEVANRQIEWADKIAQNRDTSVSDTLTALQIVDGWDYEVTSEYLNRMQLKSEAEGTLNRAFLDADRKAQHVRTKLLNTATSRMAEQINERLNDPEEYVTSKELKLMEDSGILQEYFMDLSTVDNKLAQYVDSRLKNTSRTMAAHLKKIDSSINEALDKVDGETGFMFQVDEEGNETGRVIHKYSAKYDEKITGIYRAYHNAIKAAQEMKESKARRVINKAAKKFHEDTAEIQETVDLRFFIQRGFGDDRFDSRTEYMDYLKEEYGKEEAFNMVQQAVAQYRQYQQEREAYREELLAEQAMTDEEIDIESRMETWERENSPVRSLQEKFGIPGRKINNYVNKRGHDYLITIPRRTIKGEPTGFYDSTFENLTDAQKDFHRFYMGMITQMQQYLPNYVSRDLPQNFLPAVSRDFVETMQEKGLSGATAYLNTAMVNSITTGRPAELVSESLKSYEEIDPNTGVPRKQIPIRFVNQNMKPKDLSHNLGRIMRIFSGMAINYKFKSAIEDDVNLAFRIMKEASEKEKRSGKDLLNRFGELVENREGLAKLTESTEYAIDALLYGNKREEYKESDFKVFDSWNFKENHKNRRKMKEIELKRDKLEERLDEGKISKEDYEEEITALEDQYRELGGKNLVWGKIGDRILEFTQLKGMGYNLTAGIANIGFGVISNIAWSGSGKDFTGRELMKAMGIIMKSYVQKPTSGKTNMKVANLVKKFDVLFEVTEVEYGKSTDKEAKTDSKTYNFISNNLSPYQIQRTTEYSVQGMSLVAQMLHEKVTVTNKETGKTEDISLFEAFNEQGEWKDKYEKNEEWEDLLEPGQENKFTRFRDKVIQINKYLHGNYDPNSPIQAKKYLLGRMVMQYRSWIPYGFAQRFSNEYYDDQLGRKFKGRYVSFKDVGLFSSLKSLFGQMVMSDELAFGKKGTEERFDEIDIENMKMNFREMLTLMGLMSAGIMMKASLDDEEDEAGAAYWTAMILMNQLYRVEQDIYFYTSPATFEDILRNPIPVMRTYRDFKNAMDASLEYIIQGEEYTGGNPSKKWGKALPLGNQLIKTSYLAENSIRN